jgi:hypothetical protein
MASIPWYEEDRLLVDGRRVARCRARIRRANVQCSQSAHVTVAGGTIPLCWIHFAVELINGAVPTYRGPDVKRTTYDYSAVRVHRNGKE